MGAEGNDLNTLTVAMGSSYPSRNQVRPRSRKSKEIVVPVHAGHILAFSRSTLAKVGMRLC